MRNFGKIVAVCIVLMLGRAAQADFVLTVGSDQSSTAGSAPSFTAGSTVTLGLYMHNTSGVDLKARNLGLAFDIAEPGATNFLDGNSTTLKDKLTDFVFTVDPQFLNATGTFTDPTIVASSTNPANGYDVLLDLDLTEEKTFASTVNSIASAKKLGTITFKTANDLTDGVYGFKFSQNALFDDDPLNLANSGPAGVTLEAGADGAFYNRFTIITAVPEPSSLMLVILGSSLLMVRRRKCMKSDF